MSSIIIPMLARNTNGTIQLSRKSIIAAQASATAIPTYIGSSFSQRSLRSVTSADIPDTNACFPASARTSRIAFIVTSEDVPLSKNTAIMVALPLLNALYIFSGSSSFGMVGSAMSSKQSTVSTCSTCFMLSARAAMSFPGISSITMKENAPLPNSFRSSFCPITVFMSDGR